MVKLYGSMQHSAVHLLLAKSETTILNDITWRLPSQTNDVRMRAPSARMSNIVQCEQSHMHSDGKLNM